MNNDVLIKKFNGFSGSEVFLMKNSNGLFVRKIGNVERNFAQLQVLKNLKINSPYIIKKQEDILDIEYIHGLDIITYLKHYNENLLIDFLLKSLYTFKNNCTEQKNYYDIYVKKLLEIDFSYFNFTKVQLLDKLPVYVTQSNYHGDMTLENIIYSNGQFYFIDPVTIEYDSFIFDIAKLRQDLECKWFLRKTKTYSDTKLYNIQKAILETFPESNNDYILIIALLRVFKHCIVDSFEHKFLISEINKLWK